MSQVTRTSRREQVLLFGINYARGGVACERQLPGSTSSLGGRERGRWKGAALGLEAIPTELGPHGRIQRGHFRTKLRPHT